MHGVHHEAQTLSKRALPWNSLKRTPGLAPSGFKSRSWTERPTTGSLESASLGRTGGLALEHAAVTVRADNHASRFIASSLPDAGGKALER